MAGLPPMDFLFELEVRGADQDGLRAIAQACTGPRYWPVEFVPGREERRWFGIRKAYPPALVLPERAAGRSVLAAHAEPDAEAVPFAPDAAPLLAATVARIASYATGGMDFRAAWVGSPIERTELVTLAQLQGLITGPGTNEFTRYRVRSVPSLGERRDERGIGSFT